MVRFIPRSRPLRYASVALCGGLGVLMIPPKEHVPPPLLPIRVLMEGTGRITRCGIVGATIFLDYQYSIRKKDVDNQEAWNRVHERCARRLVRLAEQNGGLYVKAGQIFANMNHVLPPVYCTIMSSLQDAVMKRPFDEILAVLKADLGPNVVEEQFEYIDPTPLAAASLAQVHRARRRDIPRDDNTSASAAASSSSRSRKSPATSLPVPGDDDSLPPPVYSKDVVVKVQYIDIAARFKGDMIAIDAMLTIAGWAYPGYDLSEIVRKLQATVEAELDFRLEASNSERAARHLRRAGFGDEVVCPTIHHDLQSPRILMMNFVKGVKINDKAGMEALGVNPKRAVSRFIDAIAYQMFISGFFHADPHAGNVLVQRMPKGSADMRSQSWFQRWFGRNKGQVVLLDYGLCGQLNAKERAEFGEIWVASVTHNDELLKSIAARYGEGFDHELFASCFLQHPYAFHSMGHKGRLTDPDARARMRSTMTEKMYEVNDIVASLPKEYALLLRTIMATKAINKDVGELVNRHRRFLGYALEAGKATFPWWERGIIYTKARVLGWHSSFMMFLIRQFHPEIINDLENSYQVSG